MRHGESDGNANGLCQGNSPGCLTTKGLSQASSLCLFTKGEYDAIYSSDLTRVVQTAQASISDAKLLNSVIYDSLLREKHAGIFEMKKRELMVTARTTSGLNERLYQPQDGESWQQLQDRVKLFYDKINESYKGRSVRILVYTSGGIHSLILLYSLTYSLTHRLTYSRLDKRIHQLFCIPKSAVVSKHSPKCAYLRVSSEVGRRRGV